MEPSKAEGKRNLKEVVEDDEDDDDEDIGGLGFGDDDKKKKGKRGTSGAGGSSISCQVEDCTVDFSDARKYHRRHKVCEFHAKAPVVRVAGLQQRFCQQCSRFHELLEFDDNKRSCRRRLAGHNERRRKSSNDQYHGEGSY